MCLTRNIIGFVIFVCFSVALSVCCCLILSVSWLVFRRLWPCLCVSLSTFTVTIVLTIAQLILACLFVFLCLPAGFQSFCLCLSACLFGCNLFVSAVCLFVCVCVCIYPAIYFCNDLGLHAAMFSFAPIDCACVLSLLIPGSASFTFLFLVFTSLLR